MKSISLHSAIATGKYSSGDFGVFLQQKGSFLITRFMGDKDSCEDIWSGLLIPVLKSTVPGVASWFFFDYVRSRSSPGQLIPQYCSWRPTLGLAPPAHLTVLEVTNSLYEISYCLNGKCLLFPAIVCCRFWPMRRISQDRKHSRNLKHCFVFTGMWFPWDWNWMDRRWDLWVDGHRIHYPHV